MTKTPVTEAPCPSMGEMNHGYPDESEESVRQTNVQTAYPKQHAEHATLLCENLKEARPQLMVTCDPSPARIELKAKRIGGLSTTSHPDEESTCSDSGFGSSTAPSQLRKLSNSSSIGLSPASSFEEYEYDVADTNVAQNIFSSPEEVAGGIQWKKPKCIGPWSPLAGTLNKTQPWVQVVGHAGSFHAGDHGRLLKRFCEGEQKCLQTLMGDSLSSYVPGYHGVVQRTQQDYIVMDDLLAHFHSPAIMDCKMGTRTYLEEELLKARERPQPRRDMFEKMVAVDPATPTEEERAQRGVLKSRYMQWRETLSSTTTLGFRIEGFKKADGLCNTNFKRTKTKQQVMEALKDFVETPPILKAYLRRLKELRQVLETSDFFRTHEVVGSSLLFVHDRTGRAGVWMIDFGKTMPLPAPLTVDHRTQWVEGNREDGYLWGLDNLIEILTNTLPLI